MAGQHFGTGWNDPELSVERDARQGQHGTGWNDPELGVERDAQLIGRSMSIWKMSRTLNMLMHGPVARLNIRC